MQRAGEGAGEAWGDLGSAGSYRSLCNALLSQLHGCCLGSLLEEPQASPPSLARVLLTPQLILVGPDPALLPMPLSRVLLPRPCLLHHFSAQMSQGRFVVTSSFHLGLFVFYAQTSVSQRHKYNQHSLA